ncbi:MAG: hypothetical protein AAFW75_29100 [Cyanobacteria bacterium J06636_16]
MSGNRYLFSYRRASLPLKISLPFILMFLSLWVAGSAALGQYFSHQLDQKQQERAEKLSALVKRETDNELLELRRYARLLATKGLIVQSVSEQDEIGLKQEIL